LPLGELLLKHHFKALNHRATGIVKSTTEAQHAQHLPFRNLIDYLEGGYSLEEFLDAFPSVSRDQAIAALGA
jgi:Protein of unknown function (DUF433)